MCGESNFHLSPSNVVQAYNRVKSITRNRTPAILEKHAKLIFTHRKLNKWMTLKVLKSYIIHSCDSIQPPINVPQPHCFSWDIISTHYSDTRLLVLLQVNKNTKKWKKWVLPASEFRSDAGEFRTTGDRCCERVSSTAGWHGCWDSEAENQSIDSWWYFSTTSSISPTQSSLSLISSVYNRAIVGNWYKNRPKIQEKQTLRNQLNALKWPQIFY